MLLVFLTLPESRLYFEIFEKKTTIFSERPVVRRRETERRIDKGRERENIKVEILLYFMIC